MPRRMYLRAALAALLVFLLLSGCVREQPSAVPVPEIPLPTETTLAPETVPATLPPLPAREPENDDLVRVCDYIPGIFQELPYGTENNFTGQVIYDFTDCYLRYGTVKKLAQVQSQLEDQGLGLKLWDGFRPIAAQYRLWEICPDPTYVSDPTKGYSSHSRGNTVDITLVDFLGNELEMPTGFDDFTTLADRDYSDCPETAAENARFLQKIMENAGFSGYWGEWWHYSDTVRYEVAQDFTPVSHTVCSVTGPDSVPLLEKADLTSPILAWLEPGELAAIQALSGDFALISCRESWGYVPRRYLETADPIP